MHPLSEKVRSRITKFDGVVFLHLDTASIEDEEIDATGIDHIAISAATVLDVTIRNLRGTMTVSGASKLSICTRLRVEQCNLARLSTSAAVFVKCAFVATTISELLGAGATFSHCLFTGSIEKGIFFPKARDPGASGNCSAFEGNDFAKCELEDVAFRGGVNLKKQCFAAGQTKLIIEEAPVLLELLNREVDTGQTRDGVRRLRDFVRQCVVDHKQQQIFVSKPLAKKFLCSYLADFAKGRDALSPTFAKWAREINRHC